MDNFSLSQVNLKLAGKTAYVVHGAHTVRVGSCDFGCKVILSDLVVIIKLFFALLYHEADEKIYYKRGYCTANAG